MKKTLSVLLVFGALTAAAEDSYLYWMVGDTTPYASGTDYTKVKIRADDNTYLDIGLSGVNHTWTGAEGISANNVARADSGALYALLGSNPTYSSFVIELWNDNSFVAQSETISRATADYYIATSSSMLAPTAWMAQSFAIPEPNSALLMLLGCAALGLRRRRLIRS